MGGELCESGSARGSEPKVYDFNLVASRGFWRMVRWSWPSCTDKGSCGLAPESFSEVAHRFMTQKEFATCSLLAVDRHPAVTPFDDITSGARSPGIGLIGSFRYPCFRGGIDAGSGFLMSMTRVPSREAGGSKHQGVADYLVSRFSQEKMLHFAPG